MGRGKLSLNLIPNRKSRISTFKKRKNSLMKKAYELSTLCDVRTCVLIHGPASSSTEDPSTQSELEFHSWPSNRADLEAMIRAYRTTSSCNFQNPKCFSMTDFFLDRKRKIESETCKLRQKVDDVMCPKWDERLELMSEHELREFMEGLNVKIEAANGMIDLMEADYEDLFGQLCSENSVQMGGDSNPTTPLPNWASPNEEEVAMDEFNNSRYLQMVLEEEQEVNYMVHYANLMNAEFDYYNNIEHLMIPTGNL